MAAADINAALIALAAAQWAVVTLEQLVALGLSASAVRKRVAAGSLHRIYWGVYALVPRELLTRNGQWLAAVYACGPGAALSHLTAAALHELCRTDATRIDVTVPGRNRRTHPGIRVHRSTTLTADDVTLVDGIPTTTVARTQLDLAETINRRGVERAFDQAESMDAFDLSALRDQLARNRTRRAAGIVWAVLREHYIGSTVTRSELEETFLALLRRTGLPAPECNVLVDFHDGGPSARADFVWRAHGVLVETDGFKTHRTRQAFEYDRRLSQRAMVAGWQPVRTTARQLERRPEEIVATVAVLLHRSDHGAGLDPDRGPTLDRAGDRLQPGQTHQPLP